MMVSLHVWTRRLRSAWDKLAWGVKAVGLGPALRGGARLLVLRLRRPARAHLRLRRGTILEYSYPSQLVPILVVFGDYIDPEYDFIELVQSPGWVVIDVGAGIGQFSAFVVRNKDCRLYAYEPNPENLISLRRNLDLNGPATCVHVSDVALGDGSLERAVFSATNSPFTSHINSASDGASAFDAVVVSTLSAEVETLELDRIDCLKVNVAGSEASVLLGGESVLSRGLVKYLIILVSETSPESLAHLVDLGYKFYFYHPKKHVLHRIHDLSLSALTRPPWPARHVIGAWNLAVDQLAGTGIRVQ